MERLVVESDLRVLGFVISALGYNSATEALEPIVGLAAHPHWKVRFHVAAALPSLVDPDQIEPGAADALRRLSHDEEAEVRYYAVHALLGEVAGVDPDQLIRAIGGLLDDPDEQVRNMARTRDVGA